MNNEREVPLFKKWRSWYWLVAMVLVAEILFFTWLTNSFS
jgi:hypothetical protein